MANTKISLLKSNVATNVPSNLEHGELAINYADGKLFYKAANDSIYQINYTAPSFGTINANSSLIIADSPGAILSVLPGENITLDTDTVNDRLTINANIRPAYAHANASFEFANTSNIRIYAAYAHANAAFAVANTGGGGGASVSTSATPPSSPSDGDLWWNSEIGKMFVFYEDVDTGQWVESSPGKTAVYFSGDPGEEVDLGPLTTFSQAAFDKANTANTTADSSFEFANTVNTFSFAARANANAAAIHANAAFNFANTANIHANSAFTHSNAAFIHANSSYSFSNTVNIFAFAARANANAAAIHANAAFNFANTANIHANAAFTKANTVCISYVIDGGGASLTVGEKGSLEIPFNVRIDRWTLLADQSGALDLDIWSRQYNATNFPTIADSVTNNVYMRLVSARGNQSTIMTNWKTTEVQGGNVLTFNVATDSTVTRATLSLFCTKT